jgi:signal transduction histidine kinase
LLQPEEEDRHKRLNLRTLRASKPGSVLRFDRWREREAKAQALASLAVPSKRLNFAQRSRNCAALRVGFQHSAFQLEALIMADTAKQSSELAAPDYVTTIMQGDQLKQLVQSLLQLSRTSGNTSAAPAAKQPDTADTEDLNAENEALRQAVASTNSKLREVERELRSSQADNEVPCDLKYDLNDCASCNSRSPTVQSPRLRGACYRVMTAISICPSETGYAQGGTAAPGEAA